MRCKIVISKTYVAQFYEVNQKSKEVSVLPYTSRERVQYTGKFFIC